MTNATDLVPPTIWILGNTQVGKTSIVAEITGQAKDDIGRGFQAQTTHVRSYLFPEENPILEFVDTPGLLDDVENASKRAAEVKKLAKRSDLVLAVVRADDPDGGRIMEMCGEFLQSRPDIPLMVAVSCLHLLYPKKRKRHILLYPFDGDEVTWGQKLKGDEQALVHRVRDLCERLRRSLPGGRKAHFVPLDFTQDRDGLLPSNYGSDRLFSVLGRVIPDVGAKLAEKKNERTAADAHNKIVISAAFAAAASGAVPVPVLSGFATAGIHGLMVRLIAQKFGEGSGVRAVGELAVAIGSGIGLSYGRSWVAQQLLKFPPLVGPAAAALLGFSMTWAVGEVAITYFAGKAKGRKPTREELRKAYREGIKNAYTFYARRRTEGGDL